MDLTKSKPYVVERLDDAKVQSHLFNYVDTSTY